MTENDSFIPFGFQYYRSPTPYRDQWETDLRRIADKGFNCVKYWIQWRASHPEENRFEFDDVRELMDLAERNGLKVVLNVIFDVAPAWFYRRYPDSVMIAADGYRLEPRALNSRQIGGAPGPCYHHPEGQREKDRFLTAAVEAFKDHPTLWVWDLWNEPELTTSIRRELAFENQVCYCGRSTAEFGEWLRRKYVDLPALNEKWQRTYGSWEEIEAPRGKAVFNDMVDWRLFMSDALTDDLRRRAAVVRTFDTQHPVMVHTVPGPIFNLITSGSDDFRLAEQCDLFGNSLGSSAWSADLLLSAAGGKKVINSEIHALPGDTAMKPKQLEWSELKRHILIPLARGITGYLFWQYRPEVLGHEAPAWGSTYLDGSDTPWLKDMERLNERIQSSKEELLRGSRPSDRIAILYSPENQIANFAAYGHLDTYFESVQGAHKLLHDLNYKVEFLHGGQLTEESLSRYRCLWMPYPLYLDERTCSFLRAWIEGGGRLVSECSFGALQAENGSHSYKVPGYGFDEVFGVRETWIHSVQHLEHSYREETVSEAGRIPLQSCDGEELGGAYYKSDVVARHDVETLARYAQDDAPAITLADYGQGSAMWIGTLLASAYWRDGGAGTRAFFRKVLEQRLGLEACVKVNGDGVRADVLTDSSAEANGEALVAHLFVHGWGEERTEAIVEIPGRYTAAAPWFEGGEARIEFSGDTTGIRVAVEPGDIQAFRLSLTDH